MQLDPVILDLSDAVERALEAAASLRADGAESHLADALDRAADDLRSTRDRLETAAASSGGSTMAA